MDSPFRTSVVVVAFDGGGGLLETYVVEAGERCAVYVLYCVIRDEEVFFPSHEYKVCRGERVVVKGVRVECFRVLVKR